MLMATGFPEYSSDRYCSIVRAVRTVCCCSVARSVFHTVNANNKKQKTMLAPYFIIPVSVYSYLNNFAEYIVNLLQNIKGVLYIFIFFLNGTFLDNKSV